MHPLPYSEWFGLIEYYAFRLFLLAGFLIWLYRRIKDELDD